MTPVEMMRAYTPTLGKGLPANAPDQAVLLKLAHGFEQTMWMLHRFALLVPQA
jgi:hypothetical protein